MQSTINDCFRYNFYPVNAEGAENQVSCYFGKFDKITMLKYIETLIYVHFM